MCVSYIAHEIMMAHVVRDLPAVVLIQLTLLPSKELGTCQKRKQNTTHPHPLAHSSSSGLHDKFMNHEKCQSGENRLLVTNEMVEFEE